jgi:hypothetical protein
MVKKLRAFEAGSGIARGPRGFAMLEFEQSLDPKLVWMPVRDGHGGPPVQGFDYLVGV